MRGRYIIVICSTSNSTLRSSSVSAFEIRIVLRVDRRTAEVVVPVGPGFDVHVLARDLRDGPCRGLVVALRRVEEIVVAIGPRLVVVVEARLVRVVEELVESAALVLALAAESSRLSLSSQPPL
jgi:hypothetical protein